MVPMLTCGLVRWNFAFATVDLPFSGVSSSLRSWLVRLIRLRHSLRCSFARRLRDDFLGDVARNLGVGVELHRVARPSLRLGPEVADVAEHLRQRDERLDDPGSPRSSMAWIWPRLELRSPITSPMFSSGVVTSTAIIGSSSTGWALRAADLNAIEPAILNAISDESTSW